VSKEAREQDFAKALKIHSDETNLKCETLPEQQQVFRMKVVTAFFSAAIPLNKLVYCRDLLEEGAYQLTNQRHMTDQILFHSG